MSSVMRFDEWQDSDGNPVFNGAGGVSPGGLVAVKSAINTGPEVFSSVGAGANVAVPDLSITHEVANASNKLIISAFFGVAASSRGLGNVGLAVAEDGVLINVGDASGSRTRVSAGGETTGSGNTATTVMPSVTFVHIPGAGSKTYTVRAINFRGESRNLFINRTEEDGTGQSTTRGVSSLVIQEVAV